MAPVGPLTLLHNGFRPTSRRYGHQALCSSASSSCLCPCHTEFDSARANRVALVHPEPPRERPPGVLAWQAPSNRSPEGFQSRRRHAHRPYAVQTALREPRFGDLARDRPLRPIELDFGHPLLDFGLPSVLRSALRRRPCSVRIGAQDARMQDHPHAERLRR